MTSFDRTIQDYDRKMRREIEASTRRILPQVGIKAGSH